MAPINLQYELINPPRESGVLFGRGTKVHVANVTFGSPEWRTNDEALPRADGLRMGRDYLGGRLISFDINVVDKSHHARDIVAALEAAWLTADSGAGPSRLRAGELSVLRFNRHGNVRRVYGRPRRFDIQTGRIDLGYAPVTCDFQTIDHKFYDEQERINVLGIVPPDSGGFTFPITFPWSTDPMSSQADVVEVLGNEESWLVARINGPITLPTVDVVGYWSYTLNVNLQAGEYVEVDPRPWARKVTRNGNQNISGLFTAGSRRLTGQTLPPGAHQVVLRGQDITGTASLEVRWRHTYTTF